MTSGKSDTGEPGMAVAPGLLYTTVILFVLPRSAGEVCITTQGRWGENNFRQYGGKTMDYAMAIRVVTASVLLTIPH
jgi:hypothetical protein